MDHFVKRKSEILSTLNDINEKLKSKESLILCQTNEISKTEKIITEFQECLFRQNNVLKSFTEEKEQFEKEKVKYLNFLQENENAMSHALGMNRLHDVGPMNSDIRRLDSFSENYEIVKSTKSLKFYRTIFDHILEASPSNDVNYLNQTVIPNKLKVRTTVRRMVLRRIDMIGDYPLEKLINQHVTMPLDIHISFGSGKIISVRGRDRTPKYHVTAIEPNKSFAISRDQTVTTEFVVSVTSTPMIMAIDIHNVVQNTPRMLTDEPEPKGYIFEPPLGTFLDSFIKRSLSLDEIRKNILFLDASFAINKHDSMIPISLVVLDYFGKVLINTNMCPRYQIKDYRTKKHGLTEQDVIGKPDSPEIMDYFYRVIYDKILVGYELEDKIKSLKVDLKYICGVRDLRSSDIFKKIIDPSKSLFTLASIAKAILFQKQSENEIYSAFENVNIVRDAYLKIEYQWRDKVPVPALVSPGEISMPQSKLSISPEKSTSQTTNVKSRLGWLTKLEMPSSKRRKV